MRKYNLELVFIQLQKENATRFFKVGFVLGKPWAWIADAEDGKQTDPKYIDKADKNKVNFL